MLRQRNALLRQVHGRLDASAAVTLDVWDQKLAEAGTALADARVSLVASLAPAVAAAYAGVAGAVARSDVSLRYDAPWRAEGLAAALAAARADELRRGVSLVGPHRDDLALDIGGFPARTQASQGEQRSLALALRLGGHAVLRGRVRVPAGAVARRRVLRTRPRPRRGAACAPAGGAGCAHDGDGAAAGCGAGPGPPCEGRNGGRGMTVPKGRRPAGWRDGSTHAGVRARQGAAGERAPWALAM